MSTSDQTDLVHDVEVDPTDGRVVLTGPARRNTRRDAIKFGVSVGISTLLIVALLVSGQDRETIGLLSAALLLALMAVGVPIGLAMVLASALGLYQLGGDRLLATSMRDLPFNSTTSWSLSVIPLFVLMGLTLSKSGVTTVAYRAAYSWLGRLPGGLAIATNLAGGGLAAASGSSVGIAYALGRVAIPEMIKVGYRPTLAVGTVAAAGTLGQLLPPSILLVVYAGVAQTPIGPQLLAAVVPGIVLALCFSLMILVRAVITPDLAPRAPTAVPWREKLRSLVGLSPIALIVLTVIGGMYSGLFTPTEAGAVGALVALLVGWLSSDRSISGLSRLLKGTLVSTAGATASIFLLVIGVALLTRILTLSGLTTRFSAFIVDLGLTRVTLLLALMVMYLVLGMFLDPLAMTLLTVPVLLEPLQIVGVDPLWFGVFVVVLGEIGLMSPPVGLLSFVVARIVQDPEVNQGQRISLVDVFRGVIWFVVVALAFVLVLIALPELATWLPNRSSA
jgi:C4-dicarboxylate transporter, DctM subunit